MGNSVAILPKAIGNRDLSRFFSNSLSIPDYHSGLLSETSDLDFLLNEKHDTAATRAELVPILCGAFGRVDLGGQPPRSTRPKEMQQDRPAPTVKVLRWLKR